MAAAHWPERLLRAYGREAWVIEPGRAEQILAALEMRAALGPAPALEAARAAAAADGETEAPAGAGTGAERGGVQVLRLRGTLMPRLGGMQAASGDFASLESFRPALARALARDDLRALVIDIDSPGGRADLVPETAAQLRAGRREGRPIVAVANTLAASGAYWIAAAADEVVVTPSGQVGSIGVYTMHEDVSAALEREGVRVTMLRAGPRKAEGNPFEPLGAEAAAAMLGRVRGLYGEFVKDVAAGRGVAEAVVRADPEGDGPHFGGGRVYGARDAVKLGMADRVATLEETLARLAGGRSAAAARRRLALG